MKRSFLAASALALTIGLLTAPAASANYEANCATGGTVVAGASMTVNGTTATKSNGAPWFYVCKEADKSYYSVMIGLYQATPEKLVSDLGALSISNEYVVTFPTGGDAITIAQGVGKITKFDIGSGSVSVGITPVFASTVWQANRPAGCDQVADPATGLYKSECSGTQASASEFTARFEVRYGTSTWTPLKGMYVSTSADLFQVDLGSTRCPTQSFSGGTSSDGGTNRPSGLRADVETNLRVQMLGPHLTSIGAPNVGLLSATLPFSTVESCFGKPPTDMLNAVSMSRTEDDTTLPGSTTGSGGLRYTVTPSAAGLVVDVPEVTFSQPTYNLKFATPATTGTTTDTSANAQTSAATIAGVKAKASKGKITATFKKDSTVKSYAAKARLSSGKGAFKKGKCAAKSSTVTCVVKKLKRGRWDLSITSTLVAGGAGPSATKSKISVK